MNSCAIIIIDAPVDFRLETPLKMSLPLRMPCSQSKGDGIFPCWMEHMCVAHRKSEDSKTLNENNVRISIWRSANSTRLDTGDFCSIHSALGLRVTTMSNRRNKLLSGFEQQATKVCDETRRRPNRSTKKT